MSHRRLIIAAIVLATTLGAAGEQQCAVQDNVHIALMPGSAPNIIDPERDDTIPVVIYGSRDVDAAKVDLDSLRLGINALWAKSRIVADHGVPRCELKDIGQPGRQHSNIRDGHRDLLCQFSMELTLFFDGVQKVTLTGEMRASNAGPRSPIAGTDYATAAGGDLEAKVRCCISCDDDGNCGGCNSDIYACTDLLMTCQEDGVCYDCTGCAPPRIC